VRRYPDNCCVSPTFLPVCWKLDRNNTLSSCDLGDLGKERNFRNRFTQLVQQGQAWGMALLQISKSSFSKKSIEYLSCNVFWYLGCSSVYTKKHILCMRFRSLAYIWHTFIISFLSKREKQKCLLKLIHNTPM
jgi:hypothetical protein